MGLVTVGATPAANNALHWVVAQVGIARLAARVKVSGKNRVMFASMPHVPWLLEADDYERQVSGNSTFDGLCFEHEFDQLGASEA